MTLFRRSVLALLALLWLCAGTVPVQAADLAGDGPATAATVAQPRTNDEIRQWYNDQVAVIPTQDAQWQKEGVSAEERARRAHDIRHNARIQARAFMLNKQEVADLQARDQKIYGNPDGPTFEYLVEKNRKKGLTGDAVYQEIIGSSHHTNAAYNEKYGVRPAVPKP